MFDRFKQNLARIGKLLKGMSRGQQLAVGALAVTLLLVILVMAGGKGGGEKKQLFSRRLNREEAAKVISALKTQDIPLDNSDEGQILISVADKDRAYKALAENEAFPKEARFMDWLWTVNLSDTEKQRDAKIAESRARFLKHEIELLEMIDEAHVSIVEKTESVFSSKVRPAKATVIVKLHPAQRLTDQNVRTIANLVAGSIDTLDPDKVVVADTTGRWYRHAFADPKFGMIENRVQLEEEKSRQISQRLMEHFMPALFKDVRVSVAVELDLGEKKTTETLIDPDKSAPITEESRKETETNVHKASEAGSTPNVAETPRAPESTDSSRTLDEKRIEKENSKTVNQTVKAVGDIKMLHVALTVPMDELLQKQWIYNVADAASPGGKKTVTLSGLAPGTKPTDADADLRVKALEEIVRNAVGITANQMDQLTIAATEFTPPTIPEEASLLGSIMGGQNLGTWVLVAVSLVALGVLWTMVRRAQPKPVEELLREGALGGAAEIAGAGARGAPLEFAPPEVPAELAQANWTKEQVVQFINRDPKAAANLVKRWRMTAEKAT
ncbi:MAG: hypothetical protein HY719_15835 [Planctomycetes bacterium]|nr:hypothetical protein [Planctomycetota bacterium]